MWYCKCEFKCDIAAGKRNIGIKQVNAEDRHNIKKDIDGIVVLSKSLEFYKFEQKKYQLMTKVALRDVSSMFKKCRK